MQDLANYQVVARIIGRDVTRGELSAEFDRVADKAHWKNPIDATIVIGSDFQLLLLREAIIFFTASVPTFEPVRAGKSGPTYRVRAAGYFATIGA